MKNKKFLENIGLCFLFIVFVIACGSSEIAADHKGKRHQQKQTIPEETDKKPAQTVDTIRDTEL